MTLIVVCWVLGLLWLTARMYRNEMRRHTARLLVMVALLLLRLDRQMRKACLASQAGGSVSSVDGQFAVGDLAFADDLRVADLRGAAWGSIEHSDPFDTPTLAMDAWEWFMGFASTLEDIEALP